MSEIRLRRLRRGDRQISARNMNEAFTEIERLSRGSIASPFSSTHSGGGSGQGLDEDDLNLIMVAKFGPWTGSYPSFNELQTEFPAKLYPTSTFDDKGWDASIKVQQAELDTLAVDAYVYNTSGLWIPEGAIALVYWRNGRWWTHFLYTFLRGTLKTQLNYNSSAQMYVNWYDGISEVSTSGTDTLTVRDNLMRAGEFITAGTKVDAFYDVWSKRWYIIPLDTGLVPFELTADLVYGTDPGADNAKILQWNAGLPGYEATGAVIRVFDWTTDGLGFGTWVGRAPGGGFAAGYQGLARRSSSGRYEIVWMEEQAKWIKFKLNSQLKYNASSVGATQITDWDGRHPPTGTVTVWNSVTDVGGVYQFWGPTDAVGYAVWDETVGKYMIVALERKAVFIEGTYATSSAGVAAFTAGVATGATVTDYWDGKNPGGTVTVKDPQGLWTRALQGGKFKAVFNERADGGDGAYIVIESQTKAGNVDFTLTAAMSAGSSTAATIDRYGGAALDILDPGPTQTMWDGQDLWKYAPIGAKGSAVYDGKIDKYRIVECQTKKPYVRGTLSGTTGATGSLTITLNYGRGVAVSGSITVQNPGTFFTWAGGEEARATYDPDTDLWTLDWVECP